MKLVTAQQMRNLDYAAINTFKVPSLELMENAGRRTVEVMLDKYGDPQGKRVAIFVGPGNNGGDGLVIARLLAARMANPIVFMLIPVDKLKGDSAVNFSRVHEFPVEIFEVSGFADLVDTPAILAECWTVVDAIFGTGLTRDVSGIFASAIKMVNESSCPVVAVDIASGLSADNGKILGSCIHADVTVTFGQAKIGQVIYPGREYTGFLEVADIGIPEKAFAEADFRIELLGKETGNWLPPRTPFAHKGTYGHLLLIAGSTGKTGAAILCSLGALRSGTGLVSLCIPYDLNHIIEASLWEAMTIPLQSRAQGFFSIENYKVIEDALHNKQALAIGPGIGTAEETAELMVKLYAEVEMPMVVDADGLNILANNTGLLKNAAGPRILTPHPGEMARLTGRTSKQIQENRLELALDFAVKYNVFIVLKGTDTLVCDPEGKLAINPTGNPGMACGGMGDVLSGIIGGFLAQGLSPWQASCLGVYSHGLAADRLAEDTSAGYLASEVADEIPYVLEKLRNTL
jgi:NAD(P)H-hydrate epimerase